MIIETDERYNQPKDKPTHEKLGLTANATIFFVSNQGFCGFGWPRVVTFVRFKCRSYIFSHPGQLMS